VNVRAHDSRVIKPDINTFFTTHSQKSIESHNLALCISYTKKQTFISTNTIVTSQEKSQEFILLTLEDNANPRESRCIIGIYPNIDECRLDQVQATRDWLLMRRKLTKPLPTGKYPIVFAPGIGGILIHEIIGHQFELSKPHSLYSPTKYPKGSKLFSENLTVIDAPLSLVVKEDFDDEGTPTRPTTLIKNGAIGSPLTDKDTLSFYPKNKYPLTGNCRRESYRHYPEPRMYSTYAENGTDSAIQVINDIEHGFYVEQISHAQVNHRKGTVMLCAGRAKIIQRGTVTDTPVTFYIEEDISSFFDVKHVCDDLLLQPGICHSASGGLYIEHGSPTLVFDNIYVRSGLI